MQLRVKIDWKTPLIIEKYTGPQNAQELMKVLDGDYNKGHAKTEVSVSRKGTGIETESYSSCLNFLKFYHFSDKNSDFCCFFVSYAPFPFQNSILNYKRARVT